MVFILGTASIGAAGIAAELGLRINWKNDGAFQSLGAFLRGASIITLASFFPIIGWLLVIPVGTFTSLGGVVSSFRRKKTDQKQNKKGS